MLHSFWRCDLWKAGFLVAAVIKSKYRRPFNNMIFNCAGPLIHGFFPINTHTIFHLWLGVHGYRGPPAWTDLPLFYIGDLSICEFWYLWGWGGRKGAIPGTNGYEWTTQVFGTDELDGTAPLNPHVIKGPTV